MQKGSRVYACNYCIRLGEIRVAKHIYESNTKNPSGYSYRLCKKCIADKELFYSVSNAIYRVVSSAIFQHAKR